MRTDVFDYLLPPDRIAQTPMEPRDHAKLLMLSCEDGSLEDRHVFDLPGLLRSGDLLVFNDSRVFKARLHVRNDSRSFEVFLLRPTDEHPTTTTWVALARPTNKMQIGVPYLIDITNVASSEFIEAQQQFILREKLVDGTVVIDMQLPVAEVFALTERFGEVPLPPYIKTSTDEQRYQTVYAKDRGSVAAPTAGLHFTPELLQRLEEQGIERAFVTLHVGLGTFRPMKSETLEEHAMHEEWIDVRVETLKKIQDTKKRGGRVIAVGTTTVRALESNITQGFTRIFITPGYQFRIIDGLLTNFHLPKSTLLVLVSAFAGREQVLHAYEYAIQHEYRFYSFGDAMLMM